MILVFHRTIILGLGQIVNLSGREFYCCFLRNNIFDSLVIEKIVQNNVFRYCGQQVLG